MYGWIPAVESRFYSAREVCVERAPRRRCARVELSVVLKRRRARHWIPWDFLPPLDWISLPKNAKEYSLHYTQNFLLISLQSVKEIDFKWHSLTFLCLSFNTYWWRVSVCMRACSDEIRFALIWCLTLKRWAGNIDWISSTEKQHEVGMYARCVSNLLTTGRKHLQRHF